MNKSKWWYLIIFVSFSQIVLATGDSLNYLSPKDTIFLSTDLFGEKIFQHKLEKKQTLFSLAKFYGLHIEELYFYNPNLSPESATPGILINVPIPNRAIIRLPKGSLAPEQYVPVYYRVSKGESLYRISKKYFDLPVDTLKQWNDLDSTNLGLNQLLHVGYMNINGLQYIGTNRFTHPLWKKSNVNRSVFNNRYDSNLILEKGAASWMSDMHAGNNELSVLHRLAPLHSMVSILNPMSRKRVYAEVVGRIPENAYHEEVMIVLSKGVANLLEARDKRFFVEIAYSKAIE